MGPTGPFLAARARPRALATGCANREPGFAFLRGGLPRYSPAQPAGPKWGGDFPGTFLAGPNYFWADRFSFEEKARFF